MTPQIEGGINIAMKVPSHQYEATIAFYRGFGFAGTYRDGGWLILSRGTLVLEFFLAPEHDPYESWFMASIFMMVTRFCSPWWPKRSSVRAAARNSRNVVSPCKASKYSAARRWR